jgi:hypothetical protein
MRQYQTSASILFLLLASILASAQDKEGFTLVKKDGTVSIYERWITFPASNPPVKAREVKGVFYFNNTIFAGLRLIRDEKKIKDWQGHVAEFKVYLQREDTTTWQEYSYHDIPWPVSDQDHFLEYKVVETIPGRKLFITFESRVNETLAPVRDGVTRMKLSGSWTLEQIGPKQVKVTYRILSMPIGIPKFLTDPIIRSNIMTTIEEYIALLEPAPK